WFLSGEGHHATEQKDAKIFADIWTAERRALRVSSRERAHIAIRLVDYPAWRVTVNGIPVAAEHAEGTAQMTLRVPEGESRIEIQFARTIDRTVGGWISVFAACGSLGLYLFRRNQAVKAVT